MTCTDTKPQKQSKKPKDKLRPGARKIVMNGGTQTRFVVIEPRTFGDSETVYQCVNLALSSHPNLAGHCQHEIKGIWARMPIFHHRESDKYGHEATGVIVAREPTRNSCLELHFHRWTEDGIEDQGIKMPSAILGRILRVIDP